MFSKAGTLSQIYKFRVGRERVFFGSFLTLFADKASNATRIAALKDECEHKKDGVCPATIGFSD